MNYYQIIFRLSVANDSKTQPAKVLDTHGETVSIKVRAESQEQAVQKLQSRLQSFLGDPDVQAN